MHNYCDAITDAYIVAICNTPLISRYTETFVNFTVNFQVNDCRIIPVVIPSETLLKSINQLVFDIIEFKKNDTEDNQLRIIQLENSIFETITESYGV